MKIYINAYIINTQIFHQGPQRSLKVTKGQFHIYSNLNLRSYGQLFVLVFIKLSMLAKIE